MKRASAVVFGLILAGMLSGCYKRQPQQQEQQLSPAVKAAVAAALGPHVSDADLTEFLRSAKLASRTKQDTEVVVILDEVVNLVRSAAQDDYQAEKYRQDAKSTQIALGLNERLHKEADKGTPCEAMTEDFDVRICKEAEELINAQRSQARRSAEGGAGLRERE